MLAPIIIQNVLMAVPWKQFYVIGLSLFSMTESWQGLDRWFNIFKTSRACLSSSLLIFLKLHGLQIILFVFNFNFVTGALPVDHVSRLSPPYRSVSGPFAACHSLCLTRLSCLPPAVTMIIKQKCKKKLTLRFSSLFEMYQQIFFLCWDDSHWVELFLNGVV